MNNMKLAMMADDGKEIVYLSRNDYEVVTTEEIENTLIIDISKIDIKYKNYFDPFIIENTTNDFTFKKKENEYILKTTEYYFIFDEKLNNILNKKLKSNPKFELAVGYGFEVEGGELWSIFFVGTVKNAN